MLIYQSLPEHFVQELNTNDLLRSHPLFPAHVLKLCAILLIVLVYTKTTIHLSVGG